MSDQGDATSPPQASAGPSSEAPKPPPADPKVWPEPIMVDNEFKGSTPPGEGFIIKEGTPL